MAEVHGTFAFQHLGHGCLASKYCNTGSKRPYPETCISKKYKNDLLYEGKYETTWIEEHTDGPFERRQCQLTISSPTNGMYKLHWDLTDYRYHGQGMLNNGYLVGHYWSEKG